jgi:hypothetical protein
MLKVPAGTAIGVAPCLLCKSPTEVAANKHGFPYLKACQACGASPTQTRKAKASLLLLGRMTEWRVDKKTLLEGSETVPGPETARQPPRSTKPASGTAPAAEKKPATSPAKSIWDQEL